MITFSFSGKTYPDFLGFFICLGMTVVLALGVKNSVIFNNVLNGINFVVWVFIFIAGFWFVDGANWRDVGFAPYGSSGVSVLIYRVSLLHETHQQGCHSVKVYGKTTS